MNRSSAHTRRRLVVAGSLLAAVTVVTLTLLPSAVGSAPGNKLAAYVVATNRGPVTACTQAGSCTPANGVNEFIYVINGNSVTGLMGQRVGATRADVPNAFVVSSVESHIFVNGVDTFDSVDTPPPGTNPAEFFTAFSGHWPSTVSCPSSGPPCNVVGSPAVVPGEDTAVLYYGWAHGSTEPNGTYVFKFTVHGTFNGAPTDLTAISAPIQMTS